MNGSFKNMIWGKKINIENMIMLVRIFCMTKERGSFKGLGRLTYCQLARGSKIDTRKIAAERRSEDKR